ncbi:MAG: zinc-binding dehydrogenase [Dehalococcoidia bacterium]
MRQVLLESPRRLVVTEAPRPTPAPGEVLVKVGATAICGTDLHIYNGEAKAALPRVPGHEVAGTIEDVGLGVSDFERGDRVAVNPILSCGSCELCIMGRENLCPQGGLLGRESDGSLREYLTIPSRQAFKLPPNIPFEEAALIQPLSTAVHAQRQALITVTDSVVVVGQGAAGLMHTRLAKLSGAFPVIAVGRSQWKLELAQQMGADVTVSGAGGDAVSEVLQLTGGLGTDVVIEAVGSPDTFQQALQMVRPGGRVVLYGLSPHPVPTLDVYSIYLKEARLLFPRANTPADFHLAVAMVAAGRIDLKPLISKSYRLEGAASAFRFAEEERRQVLRVVINP